MNIKELEKQLKPCPFCTWQPKLESSHYNGPCYWVLCGNCGVNAKSKSMPEEAVIDWNSRPEERRLQEENAQLRAQENTLRFVNSDLTERLKRMRDEGLATADLMPIHDCRRKNGNFYIFLVVDKDWAERLNDSECIYHGKEWGKHECTREYKIGKILEVCLNWEESRSYSIKEDETREGLNFCDAGIDEEYDWVGEFYSTREAAQDALCQARMIEIPAEIRKIADEKAAEVHS